MEKIIATNKKAYHEYFIEDTLEAGIELVGSEVKSIRAGKVNLKDSYAIIKNGELLVVGMHISSYEKGSYFNLDESRTRKLLVKKQETEKLRVKIEQKGYTIVPTKMYFKGSLVKLEIGIAKGKELHDKRECTMKAEQLRDIRRTIKEYNR